MLRAEHFPSPTEAGLDFITNEERIVLFEELFGLAQGLLVSEHVVEFLRRLAEEAVVDCARGKGDLAGLGDEGLMDAGVAVALVDCGVGGEEVHVFIT
ncbi:unnamed protein product [Sphagnum balticum]